MPFASASSTSAPAASSSSASFDAAVACGVEQRRHAAQHGAAPAAVRQAAAVDADAFGAAARAFARRHEIRRRADARARVDVGAARRAAARRLRGAPSRTASISAVCSNSRSRASTAAPRSSSNATASTTPVRAAVINAVSPIGATAFDVGARIEQRRDDGRAAVLGREIERRHAIAIGGVRVGAGLEQQPNGVEAVGARGPVQAPSCRRRRACRRARLDRAGG